MTAGSPSFRFLSAPFLLAALIACAHVAFLGSARERQLAAGVEHACRVDSPEPYRIGSRTGGAKRRSDIVDPLSITCPA